MELSKQFHDSIPGNKAKMIPGNLHAICLKSKCFDRRIDICTDISKTKMSSGEAGSNIVKSSYQRDGVLIVRGAYRTFNDMLYRSGDENESSKLFELRFAAFVVNCTAISYCTKIHRMFDSINVNIQLIH